MNFRLAAGETAYILGSTAPTVYVYDTDLGETAAAALAQALLNSWPPLAGAGRTVSVVAADTKRGDAWVTGTMRAAESGLSTADSLLDKANSQ